MYISNIFLELDFKKKPQALITENGFLVCHFFIQLLSKENYFIANHRANGVVWEHHW